ncbi:uncharacterized protein LOC119271913 [Triticum dicoccoides]|nr:uncharacterized protein LOC119271913 [Triticum dicoccoides]
MLGVSTGQLLVILGACSVMMKPSDMIKMARVAGRMTGRAVGRLMLYRRQMDDIFEQTAAKKINTELQDAMSKLQSIGYEVQNLSRITPGQFIKRQHNTESMTEAGTSDSSATQSGEFRDDIRSIIRDEIESFCRKNPDQFTRRLNNPDGIQNSEQTAEATQFDVTSKFAMTSKDMESANTSSTNLHSQAMMYAKLSVSPGIKMSSSMSVSNGEQFKESNGLLNVLPISAESAGLLPKHTGEPKGSDILLEAVLEAEVAENAKFFVSQPHDQLPKEWDKVPHNPTQPRQKTTTEYQTLLEVQLLITRSIDLKRDSLKFDHYRFTSCSQKSPPGNPQEFLPSLVQETDVLTQQDSGERLASLHVTDPRHDPSTNQRPPPPSYKDLHPLPVSPQPIPQFPTSSPTVHRNPHLTSEAAAAAASMAPKAEKKPAAKKPAEEEPAAEKAPAAKKPKGEKRLPAGKTSAGKEGGEKKGGKKKAKKSVETYKIYIFKVLKQVHPDIGISSKAMSIMNSFINDIFEKLAGEAAKLARYNKKPTITSREIQTSVRLVLPGELAKHAVSEGTKAVTKFTSS